MSETIRAIHHRRDPILEGFYGEEPEPTVHEVTVGRFQHDWNEVSDALVRLFRQFSLPNGGTIIIEGYGKRLKADYDDFLCMHARRLIDPVDPGDDI